MYGDVCFSKKKKEIIINGLNNNFAKTNLSQKDSPWSGNILTLQ